MLLFGNISKGMIHLLDCEEDTVYTELILMLQKVIHAHITGIF